MGTLEEVLVDKLALNLWRLRRLIIADSAEASRSSDSHGLLGADRYLMLRYESNLLRDVDRTLGQLERFQRMRLGQPVPPPIKLDISS